MAQSVTSQLILKLIDGVTAPARRASQSLLGIPDAMRRLNGQPMTFSDRLGAAIERNNAALDRARGRMLDAAAGFYALRTALSAPLSDAVEFEAALSGIGSKAGLAGAQLAAVGKAARDASVATNQTTPDILKSIDYLVGMGLSANDAMTAIQTIGAASTATKADIVEMSQASYAAMANLKVPADQVGLALDYMAQAGKRGGFELKDMAQYFPSIGAAYQALGQTGPKSVADLAAALQVMRMDTGDASSAATNLQNVLQKIYAPATVTKFKKLGINIREAMTDAAKRGLTPLEAIAEITDKAVGGDLSRISEIFEDAQAQAGVRSMIQHMREFRDIREQALGGAGTNQADFNRAMQTAEQRTKRLRIVMDNLSTTIGSALLPVVTALSDLLVPMIQRFGEWADAHPRLVAGIVSVTAAVIGLRIAMTALSYVGLLGRGGVLGAISVGAQMLGGTVGYLWQAARASVALQVALGAMSGGQTLSTFGALAVGLRGALFAIPGVALLADGIAAIGAAIATITAPAWGTFAVIALAIAAAGYAVYKYWDWVSATLSGVGRAIGEIVQPAFDALRPVLDWFAPLGDVIASGWNAAGAAIQAAIGWLSGFFSQDVLTDDQKAKAEQSGYDFVMALWNGMIKPMADLIAWATDKADQILNPFRQLKNAAGIVQGYFGGGGETSGVTSDPAGTGVDGMRAGGGPMRAGSTYLVGENGPELVTPSKGGYVHPNGAGIGAGGGGGGATVHFAPVFHFAGVCAGDIAAITQAVSDTLETKARELFSGIHADTGVRVY